MDAQCPKLPDTRSTDREVQRKSSSRNGTLEYLMSGRKTAWAITAGLMMMACHDIVSAAEKDHVRDLQTRAIESRKADWGRWGSHTDKYSSWVSHSNRLIPIYSFGMGLDSVSGKNSPYRSVEKL